MTAKEKTQLVARLRKAVKNRNDGAMLAAVRKLMLGAFCYYCAFNWQRGGDVELTGGRQYDGTGFPQWKAAVPYAPGWDKTRIEELAHEVLPEIFAVRYELFFEPITDIETKMMITVDGEPELGLEQALSSVFAASGSNTGKKLRVELIGS